MGHYKMRRERERERERERKGKKKGCAKELYLRMLSDKVKHIFFILLLWKNLSYITDYCTFE
jgi:hypothetical protein